MAARALKRETRIHEGREIMLIGDRWICIDPTSLPAKPSPEQIIAQPTDRYPRWRLRVFNLCWPWRATMREALVDARLSLNGRYDREDRLTYLDAAADIQRDPPPYMDQLRRRMARGEL